jgi:hypothetical protein
MSISPPRREKRQSTFDNRQSAIINRQSAIGNYGAGSAGGGSLPKMRSPCFSTSAA